MGIFKKIRSIFTDPQQQMSDELDQVSTPYDVVNSWANTLSKDDRAYLITNGKVLKKAGIDYVRYYTLTHYLCQPPHNLTLKAASDAAKKKVAPLLARYEHITENEWTDAELDQWLESLDEPHRNMIDDAVRTCRAKGFTNDSKLLCRLRRGAIHREAVEQAQAPSLLHMLYEFNDERSKVAQHQAARNINKFFGQ